MTGFVDLARPRLVDVVGDRTGAAVASRLSAQPTGWLAGIAEVALDPHRGYFNGLTSTLPHAGFGCSAPAGPVAAHSTSQKNDPNDARSVAALRSDRLGRVRPDDHALVLRLLAKWRRDMAQLRSKHGTRLHALLGGLAAGGIGTESLLPRPTP